MKKWFKFFCLSFFDHKLSKEGEKRGYTNAFLGLLLTFIFIWSGFVGAEMLPFSTRYDLATDLRSTVQSVFAGAETGVCHVQSSRGRGELCTAAFDLVGRD